MNLSHTVPVFPAWSPPNCALWCGFADVVPCMPEFWRVDPFAAEVDADGNILARGTQDMKSVCMQYLECKCDKGAGAISATEVSVQRADPV